MLGKRLGCVLAVTAMAAVGAVGQEKSPSNINAHHIEVLVLDGTSGKPVRGAWVSLRGMGQSPEANWLRSEQSNSQGMAEFSFPDPIPERVSLSFDINAFGSCFDTDFPTERILKSGIVAGDFCAAPPVYSSHQPFAGQLVMYGRAITARDRISEAIPFVWLFRVRLPSVGPVY